MYKHWFWVAVSAGGQLWRWTVSKQSSSCELYPKESLTITVFSSVHITRKYWLNKLWNWVHNNLNKMFFSLLLNYVYSILLLSNLKWMLQCVSELNKFYELPIRHGLAWNIKSITIDGWNSFFCQYFVVIAL